MAGVVLGQRYEEELQLLVDLGVFNNRSEAIRRGVNVLVESLPPETRMRAGVLAYQKGATLSRAAEIAHVAYDMMRDRLYAEGTLRDGHTVSAEDRERKIGALSERMKKRK